MAQPAILTATTVDEHGELQEIRIRSIPARMELFRAGQIVMARRQKEREDAEKQGKTLK
mgnify:CR=1 FL=1|jgi:hypothetical protein